MIRRQQFRFKKLALDNLVRNLSCANKFYVYTKFRQVSIKGTNVSGKLFYEIKNC